MSKNHETWYAEYHADDVKLALEIEEYLYQEETGYQKIAFMKNRTFGTFFTLDGYVMVTEKDEFIYHEMICHPAMAVNPAAQRVLIVGGGDGGAAREMVKYRMIEKIDLVELDERVVRLCQKYLPQTAGVFELEPRINLHFCDGLQFVKQSETDSYDVILVDSTDPIGYGEGLFSIDFYQNCYRILSPKGILINQHEGAFYEGDIREMKRAHRKIDEVFPISRIYGFNIPSYASGYWYFGFASKCFDPLLDQQQELWQNLHIETNYYNSQVHKGCFALPNYVQKLLKK
ncbi:MAG: polyamine aminopropyltransferase [Bacillota bacterium]|jgi:spermidine synthase